MTLGNKTGRGRLDSIRSELSTVVIFVAVVWVVFVLEFFLPLHKWFPLSPRSLWGLIGIFTMPFLHGDIWHILANTLPLIVLLSLLVGSRAQSWHVVVLISLIGGAILWLFGNPGPYILWMLGQDVDFPPHIGASLLIFGLITFLVSSGVLEKRLISMMVAGIVLFTYGFTLIFGIIPKGNSEESWDGHLSGAIAGVVVAYIQHQSSKAQPPKSALDSMKRPSSVKPNVTS